MIEKMKIVSVIAPADKKDSMLKSIKNLGVLHIKEKKKANTELLSKFDELCKVELLLKEYPQVSYESDVLSDKKFEKLHSNVLKAINDKKNLSDKKVKLGITLDKISVWGDFDPNQVRNLRESGISLFFYKMGKKEFQEFTKLNVSYVKLASVDKMNAVAVIGEPLDKSFPASEFVLPEFGMKDLKRQIDETEEALKNCEEVLVNASGELASYKNQILKCKNEIVYSSASNTSNSDEDLVWLTGYIPQDDEDVFKKVASKNKWAYLIDDVQDDDETVPTKVRYSKISALMQPVFDILGTIPGYREYDISFFFLCFFSLFFAMIIGDAGYGVLFLLLGIGLNIKQKKTTNLTLLIYVVSVSTIAWGALTGTWFGLESAMNIPVLRNLVVKPLANYPELFGISATSQQNAMMKLCFIIGTVQLTLACVMSIRRKLTERNLSWLADTGWLLSINSLYYVVLLLVIGEDINIAPLAVLIGVGFVLVCVFGAMEPGKSFKDGLKEGLGGAFTNFLDTISAFGNVMSYIRLFAVGLASLAIAQSFNDMAAGFTGILKVLSVLIFIVGHALNLVMGLLSVVVHGVRLNLLEFSGQLGMEWSGIAYEPFKAEEK